MPIFSGEEGLEKRLARPRNNVRGLRKFAVIPRKKGLGEEARSPGDLNALRAFGFFGGAYLAGLSSLRGIDLAFLSSSPRLI